MNCAPSLLWVGIPMTLRSGTSSAGVPGGLNGRHARLVRLIVEIEITGAGAAGDGVDAVIREQDPASGVTAALSAVVQWRAASAAKQNIDVNGALDANDGLPWGHPCRADRTVFLELKAVEDAVPVAIQRRLRYVTAVYRVFELGVAVA